jgi:hypothetical protein
MVLWPISQCKRFGRSSATPSVNTYSRTVPAVIDEIAPQQAGGRLDCDVPMMDDARWLRRCAESGCARSGKLRQLPANSECATTDYFVPDLSFQWLAMRRALDGYDAQSAPDARRTVDAATCRG